MTPEINKITIGKGRSTEKNGVWKREYFEVEIYVNGEDLNTIKDEYSTILNSWLDKEETVNTPLPIKNLPKELNERSLFGSLTFKPTSSKKLKNFEISIRQENNSEKFNLAYSILSRNQSLIHKKFSSGTYVYEYWIWPDKKPDTIYRILRDKSKST